MKRPLRALLCLLIVVSCLATMAINAFAANKSFSYKANTYGVVVTKTVKFDSGLFSTNKITVENNGSVPIFIYFGSIHQGLLSPGKQMTVSSYGWQGDKRQVNIYVQKLNYSTGAVRIKTTSGTIT